MTSDLENLSAMLTHVMNIHAKFHYVLTERQTDGRNTQKFYASRRLLLAAEA